MLGWMVRRYLDRLGVDWAGSPDLDALRQLHRQHLEHIPFENLSIHLREPVVLDEVELVAKITIRRRGGFCYEQNGAFAWLLRSLGYRVDLLQAGVFTAEGTPRPPFDHLVLRVHLDDQWLVDVGFGDSHAEPLLLHPGIDQHDPAGNFRLVEAPDADDAMLMLRDGRPQYKVSLHPHPLSAFADMCLFHQTSPESPFTRNTICSRLTPHGRVTLRGRTLITAKDGCRLERDLADDELITCYRDTFDLELSRLPGLGS